MAISSKNLELKLDNNLDVISETKILDISLIKENSVVCNYQKMCKLLNENAKTGNAKKAQIKEWARYFEFKNVGHKFHIGKKFDTLADKKKQLRKVVEYIPNIEKLVLDLLLQEEHDGIIFLSKNKLFRELNMINDNYSFCKYNIPKLSKYIAIEQATIDEFYKSATTMLKGNLERALDQLASRFLVTWFDAVMVCVVNADVDMNTLDKIVMKKVYKGKNEYDEDIYDFEIDNNLSRVQHRPATDKEIQIINNIEHTTLQKYDCIDEQELIKKHKWHEFKSSVNDKLFKEMNILFYYDAYKILCTRDNILKEWMNISGIPLKYSELINEQLLVNKGVSQRLLTNATRRHNLAIKKYKELNNISAEKESLLIRRIDNEYIGYNESLIDTLINKDATNIKTTVREMLV